MAFNLSFAPGSSGAPSPVIGIGGADTGGASTLGFSFSLAVASSPASPGAETASAADSAGGAGSEGGIGTRAFRITFGGGAAGVPVSGFIAAGAVGAPAGGTVPPGGGTGTGGRLTDMGGADFRVSNGVIDIRGLIPGLAGAMGGAEVPGDPRVEGAAVGPGGMGGVDFGGSNGVIDIRSFSAGFSVADAPGSGVARGAAGAAGGGGGAVGPAGGAAGWAGVVWPGVPPVFNFSFRRGSWGAGSSLMPAIYQNYAITKPKRCARGLLLVPSKPVRTQP